MSYLHVQRLIVIAEDYLAVRQAVSHSLRDTSLPNSATLTRWRGPNDIRDDVQVAREYRNSVVHPDGTTRAAIPFSDARSILSKFLARLP